MFNDQGEVFCFYDDKGTKLDFDGVNWIASDYCNSHQIIAPPKIVEVSGWVALYTNENGGYCFGSYTHEPVSATGYIAKQQHTFRFEVPNDS
jgi:hypothetical protein